MPYYRHKPTQERVAQSRQSGWWAVVSLILLPFAILAPLLLCGEVVPWPRSGLGTDFLTKQWPNIVFVRRALWQEGHWPLWQPTMMLGNPFLGNASSLLFYPAYWLALILPPAQGLNLLFIVHVSIMMIGTYLVARSALDLGRAAALIAALTFGLSHKTLAHIAGGHLDIVLALAWLPWSMWAVHHYHSRYRTRWIVLSGITLALAFLSHPPTALLNGLVAGTYALFLWMRAFSGAARHRRREALLRGGFLVLAPCLAFALAGVQAMAMLTLMPFTTRAALSLAEASQYALPPSLFLTALVPSPLQFPEWTVYLGIAPIVLLPVLLWSAQRTATQWFLIAMAGVSGVLSLGDATPLFALAYQLIPGLSWIRVPSRFWFLVLFGCALLAGQGFDTLTRTRVVRERALRAMWTILAVVYAVGTALVAGLIPTWRYDMLEAALTLLPMLLWYWGASRSWQADRRRRSWVLAAPLVIVAVLDAGWQAWRLIQPVPIEHFVHPTAAVEVLAAQSTKSRVYGIKGTLSPAHAAYYGFDRLHTAEPFHLAHAADITNRAAGCPTSTYSVVVPACELELVPNTPPNADLLGLLNVRHVVAPYPLHVPGLSVIAQKTQAYVYKNERALPFAFVVHRAQVLADQENVWASLETADLANTVLLVDALPEPLSQERTPSTAVVSWRTSNAVEIALELDQPGVLVVSQAWAPGWQAFDNSVKTPVYRVNYALQGIFVQAGEHTIELTYRPKSWGWGMALTGSGILVTLLYLTYIVVDRARKRALAKKRAIEDPAQE